MRIEELPHAHAEISANINAAKPPKGEYTMVKNPNNRNTGYEEAFDVERIEEIAEKAKKGRGTTGLSDLECFVYEIMRSLIEYGKEA